MDMEVTINLHYKSSASSLWPHWSQVSINTVWIKWWRADRLHFPNCAKTNAKYAEDGKRLTGNRECYFISQSNRLAPFLFLFFLLEWHWHLCVLSLLVHLAEFTGQCWASQVAQWLKNWSANAGDAGDAGSIPGSGWFPGEGNGNSLQYSCLESPVARGAWRAAVHSIAKSCMWWATEHAHTHTGQCIQDGISTGNEAWKEAEEHLICVNLCREENKYLVSTYGSRSAGKLWVLFLFLSCFLKEKILKVMGCKWKRKNMLQKVKMFGEKIKESKIPYPGWRWC